jgi:hypothetical protein
MGGDMQYHIIEPTKKKEGRHMLRRRCCIVVYGFLHGLCIYYIVLGEFNTGKSTLINLLLKRPFSDPLVKEAATVETHRIYRIK